MTVNTNVGINGPPAPTGTPATTTQLPVTTAPDPASVVPGTSPVLDYRITRFINAWLSNGTSSVTDRTTLAKTAKPAQTQQYNTAALDALIPIPYGQPMVPGLVANVVAYQGKWVFWVIWCEGPIDSFITVYNNEEVVNKNITNYLGTSTGALDSGLQAAMQANGYTDFAETLPNLAYSVISITYDKNNTATPNFTARVKGIKPQLLYEAQRNLLTYSNTFSNAAWTKTATVGALVAAPDGTPTAATLTDNSAGVKQDCFQSVTVLNDNSVYMGSAYVLKTTGGTSPTFGFDLSVSGGTPVTTSARINTDSGAVAGGGNVSVVDAGTYWRLIGKVTNNTSGNTTLKLDIFPAASAFGGGASDNVAATGSNVACWTQLELASAVTAYQPIATTYAADTTPAWTDNPSRIFADFMENARWGPDKTTISNSVSTCANYNDVILGVAPNTEASRKCDILIDREANIKDWVETLRTASGCFVAENQGIVKFIPDVDLPPVATYAHDSGQIISISSPQLKSPTTLPTSIDVTYMDNSVMPWRDATTTPVERPGVPDGSTPFRKSVVEMRWITRGSQARREATERLNKQWTRALSFNLVLFDEGLTHEPGDIIAVTYPDYGFSALPARVIGVSPSDAGWALACEKHDPAGYSLTVVTAPSIPNTSLPTPSGMPGYYINFSREEVFQDSNGLWASRIYFTWDVPVVPITGLPPPFLDHFLIVVMQGGNLIEQAHVTKDLGYYRTMPLVGNLTYTITAAAVSTSGVTGIAFPLDVLLNGKQAKPSDVPNFGAYELGGELRLSWLTATDLDLTGYEIRYGATSVSWAAATLLDRVAVPALTYTTRRLAAGTYDILIKALDSVRSASYPFGQESVNASRSSITISSDPNSFVAASQAFSSATLKNVSLQGGAYVTDFGQTWGALFPNAMSTYGNALLTYHTSGTSALWSNIIDFGSALTGDFSSTMTYTELAGVTPTKVLQLLNAPEATKTITNATNATPIVITATAHGYSTGDEVLQASVGGNANANGRFMITVVDANTYSLQDFAGNNIAGSGAYTSGGTASRWLWNSYATNIKTTARYARNFISVGTTGTLSISALGTVQVNVVSRPDSGIATIVNAGGTDPTVVSFNRPVNKVQALVVTPTTVGVLRSAVYDQIEVSSTLGIQTGRTLRFDGATQSVSRNSLTLGSSICFEAWVKPDAAAGYIFNHPCDGFTTTFGLLVTNSVFCFRGSVTTTFLNISGATVSWPALGLWCHVAVVLDNANNIIILYLNGVEAGRCAYINPTSTSNARTFKIGNVSALWFKGCIDEARLWNGVRTATEISTNMSIELNSGTNLTLCYHFNEVSGTSAADATGNGNTGTLNGYGSTNNNQWRPYDGFDCYLFDSAGAKQSGTVSWQSQGV